MFKFTIQNIFKTYRPKYIENHKLSKEQWKIYNAIINCGTKNLEYHICTGEECGSVNFNYPFQYNIHRLNI